jgi:hypothetical protein
MSLNFGAILIQAAVTPPEDLLPQLGVQRVEAAGQISLGDAIRSSFEHTAIGYYQQHTIVINHLLPSGCSFTPGKESALDERLAHLSSASGFVLCFSLDGHSSSAGFSVFAEGQRIRRRAVDSTSVLVDDGDPLPPERAFSANDLKYEARIFALSAMVLGQPFDTIMFSEEENLTAYIDKTKLAMLF